MDSVSFLKLAAKILFAGPVFTLIYPLYASIQAMESGLKSNNRQCLTYWILFSLITLLEITLAGTLKSFEFWPYARGIAASLLVVPCFDGASYLYQHSVRIVFYVKMQMLYVWFKLWKGFAPKKQDDFLVAAKRYIKESGSRAVEKHIIHEGYSKEPVVELLDGELVWPSSSRKAQKEWCCALCLVSTNSNRCLEEHLRGKKHKMNAELNYLMGNEYKDEFAPMFRRFNGFGPVEDWNQFIILKVEWLAKSPVARPIRWCRWEKPMMGWTKLNTDGSIDRYNSGLGGLLRDHKGNPICAYVTKAPRDGIFSLELLAIWRGLVLAVGQGIKAIWVESDSLSAVRVINKQWSCPHKATRCLYHIWELLTTFEKYRVSHSWREANRAADHLAKMDLPFTDVVLWPVDFPDPLVDIIREDAEGMEYYRL
ncbi:PREDICTED: uncharacterized protein LOC104611957 [Nelumbo nucifera]|uniref:Uncharacterized protein LOC104611957 n=1 Tax=Nelumbo nucifera TaxID=4432 RepID=A0A1U8B8V9_NELNU|nr:PREDICTED: uncharacterized protein LOC104611957 [Nelumbo nucifera]